MGLRKGEFIGFWAPAEVKRELQQIAASEHRTLSQQLNLIAEEIVKERRQKREGQKEGVKR